MKKVFIFIAGSLAVYLVFVFVTFIYLYGTDVPQVDAGYNMNTVTPEFDVGSTKYDVGYSMNYVPATNYSAVEIFSNPLHLYAGGAFVEAYGARMFPRLLTVFLLFILGIIEGMIDASSIHLWVLSSLIPFEIFPLLPSVISLIAFIATLLALFLPIFLGVRTGGYISGLLRPKEIPQIVV